MFFLENIRLLKDDLVRLGWIMTLFKFVYNKQTFFVEVIRYRENENKPKYALVKLRFLKESNTKEMLSAWANTITVEFEDIKKFRLFFDIKYSNNLGDIVQQFIQYFSTKIPSSIHLSAEEEKILIQQLSLSDSEDPNKRYCFALRRNPMIDGKQTYRSVYNDQKAKMLRPQLYDILFRENNDATISFCFSSNPEDELDDKRILTNFAR